MAGDMLTPRKEGVSISEVDTRISIVAPADHTHDLAEINISGASLNDTIKWNGTNWVATAPSGGGSPGGSNTQIQYNNAGAFAGSSKMTFDGTDLTLDMPGGVISIGDVAGAFGETRIIIEDILQSITFRGNAYFQYSGEKHVLGDDIRLGDPNNDSGNGYSAGIRIGTPNKTVNVITPNASANIGDTNTIANGTLLAIDDANQRATFNKKAVITDTGSLYLYDSGTSTYWKWESVSGVLTGTDTGSASLP